MFCQYVVGWYHDAGICFYLDSLRSNLGTILYHHQTIWSDTAGAVHAAVFATAGTVGLNQQYGVDNILLRRSGRQDTVELDTIDLAGRRTKIYAAVTYMPEHYKLHKKFLISYYADNVTEAMFFAQQLQAHGPPAMRQYYTNMIQRLRETTMPIWDHVQEETPVPPAPPAEEPAPN